jgi:hypothetical protein
MTPVYQTKFGKKGNCFAACIASILERELDDCDIDMEGVKNFRDLLTLIEAKVKCKIYYTNHEAIEHGFLKTAERLCFIEVCGYEYGGDPYHEGSIWHAVVAEIGDDGKISMRHNPEKIDQRKSLDQFPAIRKVFFVKPND